jgi:hypothetical protein
MTYRIDLHCHTKEKSFDGHVPVRRMLEELVEGGFSGVVLTDHNHRWSEPELDALRGALPPDFFLAAGQEVRVGYQGVLWGDVLLYGADRDYEDGLDVLELTALLGAREAFALAAHPGAPRGGLGARLTDIPVLAAEAWNGRYGVQVARESARLARAAGLPCFGGSDAHREKDLLGGGTDFPRLPKSLQDLRAMLAAGECAPYSPLPLADWWLFKGL